MAAIVIADGESIARGRDRKGVLIPSRDARDTSVPQGVDAAHSPDGPRVLQPELAVGVLAAHEHDVVPRKFKRSCPCR